ncbi:MAG: DUF5667 domain-containing protein [Candidatus Nomurabacteria bacterium]|nr:DUF5667 domain-containing protein [Candidatus Nomurabacteria bacterium]
MIPFIIALVIAITGGTATIAEKSIPGDFLYGVKVHINEPVAGVFAFTKEEKTEWQERIVERRLDEAQKLISNNNLDEATRLDLQNQISSQITEFNTNVNALSLQKNQSVNSSDLNIRLQASLNAYKSVLENLSTEVVLNENTKIENQKLISNIDEATKKINTDNQNLETNVGVIPLDTSIPAQTIDNSVLALDKQRAAENLLNSAKLSYQKEKINLSTNIQNQISSKLSSAETSIEEGKILITSIDYTNSIEKFQTSINTTNSAKLLMLSNTIKRGIEDDNNFEKHGNDIENEDFNRSENDD